MTVVSKATARTPQGNERADQPITAPQKINQPLIARYFQRSALLITIVRREAE